MDLKDVLQELLLQKGVSESHIKKMKRILNFREDPFLFYYEQEETTYNEIPLSKIKSLGFRGSSGLSWYDHVCCKATNIDKRRCQKAYEHLAKQSLEDFQNFYKESPVRLIYFEDDDFYAVNGDGTHRTLWAKITGAPTILAEITIARKNYLAYESFNKDLGAAFKFKTLLQNTIKIAPQKVESILLSVIRKITESEKIGKYVPKFMRIGLDLYCIDKALVYSK